MIDRETIAFTERRTSQGTAVGVGRDRAGRRVVVGVDRATWLLIGMLAYAGETADLEIESWRIARREQEAA